MLSKGKQKKDHMSNTEQQTNLRWILAELSSVEKNRGKWFFEALPSLAALGHHKEMVSLGGNEARAAASTSFLSDAKV